MASRPSIAFFAALRELRRPLAVLAMVFVFTNVALPAAAQAGGWSVLCSGIAVSLPDDDTTETPPCEWCAAQAPATFVSPQTRALPVRWNATPVAFAAPLPAETSSVRPMRPMPRGPPLSI